MKVSIDIGYWWRGRHGGMVVLIARAVIVDVNAISLS